MSKIAVVYWSGTGNTQTMAEAILEGARTAGAEAEIFTPAGFRAEMMDSYDAIAFGCPAMGAEELEEGEFEPMFSACEGKLAGKRIALFGSYGWGDGEWMRAWHARCAEARASFAAEDVICCEAPDDAGKANCIALGKAMT